MPVPYQEIKWIKNRLDRLEKRVEEISKTQTKIRERALKLAQETLKTDNLLDGIFTQRCDLIDEALRNHVERLMALELKVLPNLHKDIKQLRKILPINDGPPDNPLDKRKRKPKT